METNYLPKNLAFSILSLVLISFATYAQVGIGTTDPKTTLDVNGALSLRENPTEVTLAATSNNLPLGANPFSFYRVTSASDFTITGLIPVTGADGQLITIMNTSSNTMILAHDSNLSAEANRIFCPGASNFVLVGQYATTTLQYNKAQQRWVLINYADKKYGDNIQSSIGTTDISTNSNTFSDMVDMSITFTPVHSVVYVTFSASGEMDLNNGIPLRVYADFRLVDTTGPTVITGTTTLVTDSYTSFIGSGSGVSWNAQIAMYPVTVIPGVPITLKIEWLRNGGAPQELQNLVNSKPNYTHRALTIFD